MLHLPTLLPYFDPRGWLYSLTDSARSFILSTSINPSFLVFYCQEASTVEESRFQPASSLTGLSRSSPYGGYFKSPSGFALSSSVFNRREMAYTPSPQPGFHGLGATGLSTTQPVRPSDTPPFPHGISKRDKRRLALSDRLTEISTNFTNHREAYYRSHMHTLQLDMNYINNANLYENKPLEDSSEDILEGLSANVPGPAIGSRSGVPGLRLPDIEAPPRAGRWAAKFVHEINDEFEEKDVKLVLLAENYNTKVRDLKEDFTFGVTVARKEHERLLEQIRERVVQSVMNKRANLLKEKDRLDIGDTNALLNHANPFSLINGASPSDALSNRKTRHTRHRLEIDDYGTAGDGHKRKRKALVDTKFSSPSPTRRANIFDAVMPWKEGQAKLESHQMGEPTLTVEEIFSDKDRTMTLQLASTAAIDSIAAKRRRLGVENYGSGAHPDANTPDAEDNVDEAESAAGPDAEHEDIFLTAPEMDRTANSSFYATRSTRNAGLNVPIASFDIPADLAGRASAIPLMGTYTAERKKDDDPKRAPPLTPQEVEADLALIAAAIREEQKTPGAMNKKAKKERYPPTNDYVSAAFSSEQQPAYSAIRLERGPN